MVRPAVEPVALSRIVVIPEGVAACQLMSLGMVPETVATTWKPSMLVPCGRVATKLMVVAVPVVIVEVPGSRAIAAGPP